jgi:hypothetical protein
VTDRLPARCVLVTADRALAATVTELVGRMSGAELVASLPPARLLADPPGCDVLIVADDPDRLNGAGGLAAACPGAGIVFLARRRHRHLSGGAGGRLPRWSTCLGPGTAVEAVREAAGSTWRHRRRRRWSAWRRR